MRYSTAFLPLWSLFTITSSTYNKWWFYFDKYWQNGFCYIPFNQIWITTLLTKISVKNAYNCKYIHCRIPLMRRRKLQNVCEHVKIMQPRRHHLKLQQFAMEVVSAISSVSFYLKYLCLCMAKHGYVLSYSLCITKLIIYCNLLT